MITYDGTGDIEVIRTGHRTAAAWPSIHHTGQVYGWRNPAGDWTQDIPPSDPFAYPGLPAGLIEFVTQGKTRDEVQDVDLGEARAWVTDGTPCQAVEKVLAEFDDEHPRGSTRKGQIKLLRHGEQGHQGVGQALGDLLEMFLAKGGDEGDWSDLLLSAPGQIKERTQEQDKRCCGVRTMSMAELAAKHGQEMPTGQDPDPAQDQATPPRWPAAPVRGDKDDLCQPWAGFGAKELSGIFGRGRELVFTPRVDEAGYVKPQNERDQNGPAQIRIMDANMLQALVQNKFACGYEKENKAKVMEWISPFPDRRRTSCVERGPDEHRGGPSPELLRDHPYADPAPGRHDPGPYRVRPVDGILYLPDPRLISPRSRRCPRTRTEAGQGADRGSDRRVPFRPSRNRTSIVGQLAGRVLHPDPAPRSRTALPVGGHQPPPTLGAGRVSCSDPGPPPRPGDAGRTAPGRRGDAEGDLLDPAHDHRAERHFDNVRGKVVSSILDGLLTTADWSDRNLGKAQELPTLRNDRLWIVTSNNATLGGDLARRILPVKIDPNRPHPHLREFRIENLKQHVTAHRGAILAAMLDHLPGLGAGRPAHGPGREVGRLPGVDGRAVRAHQLGRVRGHVRELWSRPLTIRTPTPLPRS